MNCPNAWMDIYNSVKMIGHHLCHPQPDLWIPCWQRIPYIPYSLSGIIQMHFAIFDFPKQAFPSARNDRDEIRARSGITKIGQAGVSSGGGELRVEFYGSHVSFTRCGADARLQPWIFKAVRGEVRVHLNVAGGAVTSPYILRELIRRQKTSFQPALILLQITSVS